MSIQSFSSGLVACLWMFGGTIHADEVFIEAESFADHGGWKLDTQFIQTMHSPYLLAHGLGQPVADAITTFAVENEGPHHVWIRDLDWVAKFETGPPPGKFQVAVDQVPLPTVAGSQGSDWAWRRLETVDLSRGDHEIRLIDATGFDGRCDAIYITDDGAKIPPQEAGILTPWRRAQLNLPDQDMLKGPYDFCVVGGGYAGMAASIAAARMGLKVALIQDRLVLGGNGSSEVRVWAMGNIRRGKYSRIGEIVEEFTDHATKSPGSYEEFGDSVKEQIVRDEPNIDLFLGHHAYQVAMSDDDQIKSITAIDVRSGASIRFVADRFADCTGHGTIGFLAGADFEMSPTGRMGMSNMWAWDEIDNPPKFPATPWALDLSMKDFPYPRDHHGQWFWESGFDKDAIGQAESIRDHNLRAVFGAFNAMKNGDGADQHRRAVLTWVAYVGGPRESRRLMGDVLLTDEDIISKRDFEDGFVPSTWAIDLHEPKEQYAAKFPDNPFISKAVFDHSVDRTYGYPIPYRCFYSRNIDNLFMAGRCTSVTHEALGTVRVMKTCGMMGEVVGRAAAICEVRSCAPAEVYERYLPDLIASIELPGAARRDTPQGPLQIGRDALDRAPPEGMPKGLSAESLAGVVVDDSEATVVGQWKSVSDTSRTFVGNAYQYAAADSGGQATFTITPTQDGLHELAMYIYPHPNRAPQVHITATDGVTNVEYTVDQRTARDDSTVMIGQLRCTAAVPITVVIDTKAAGGVIHLDAIRLRPL